MSKANYDEKLTNEISQAQLEKLRLEITQMENDRYDWVRNLTPFTNLFSVIIAVGGFLFGIYQFQSQQSLQNQRLLDEQEKFRISQDREMAAKIQERMNSNIEKLLLFTQDEKITIAQATYLLIDLKTQIKLKAQGTAFPDATAQTLTREVSHMLIQAIEDDCNFEKYRDNKFVFMILDKWGDLEDYLKDYPRTNYVLDNFADALYNFCKRDPSFFKNLYSYDKFREDFSTELSTLDRENIDLLITNYETLFEFLTDKDEKEEMAKVFQAVTCNPELTKIMLDVNFDPKTDKRFKMCPNK